MSEERLTIGDIKKHKGEIRAWVNIFGEDGAYVKVSKASILRAIGADVPFSDDGLADETALCSGARVSEGVFFID